MNEIQNLSIIYKDNEQTLNCYEEEIKWKAKK